MTSHFTPACVLRLQRWTLCPSEGHSPRNSSFPVHLTWSRWTGPFPWPKPPAASAPPLRTRSVSASVCVAKPQKTLLSSTCVPAVCRPQPHSGRSSPSRKYFPSRHGDTPPPAPPSCRRRRPPGAPEDLTGQKASLAFMRVFGHSSQRPATVLNVSCCLGLSCHPKGLQEVRDPLGGPAVTFRWGFYTLLTLLDRRRCDKLLARNTGAEGLFQDRSTARRRTWPVFLLTCGR